MGWRERSGEGALPSGESALPYVELEEVEVGGRGSRVCLGDLGEQHQQVAPPQTGKEELLPPGPVGGGWQKTAWKSSVLCSFRRGENMELERIVSAALLSFVQAHLPEADLR
jgi:hypothetical protein